MQRRHDAGPIISIIAIDNPAPAGDNAIQRHEFQLPRNKMRS